MLYNELSKYPYLKSSPKKNYQFIFTSKSEESIKINYDVILENNVPTLNTEKEDIKRRISAKFEEFTTLKQENINLEGLRNIYKSNFSGRSSSFNFSKENSTSKFSNNFINEQKKLKTIRILLVDDEKLIRTSQTNVINKFLKNTNLNYEIIPCEDGIECLYQLYKGIVNNIKFNMILTDETMNFMKGSLLITTISNLISQNVLYPIKIFIVTSYENSAIYHRYEKLVNKVYTKPLKEQNISDIFREFILDNK